MDFKLIESNLGMRTRCRTCKKMDLRRPGCSACKCRKNAVKKYFIRTNVYYRLMHVLRKLIFKKRKQELEKLYKLRQLDYKRIEEQLGISHLMPRIKNVYWV